MQIFSLLLTFLVGAALTVQAGINSGLRERMGQPVCAALVSLTISVLALLCVQVLGRLPWPGISRLSGVSWWMWTGGLLGAYGVFMPVILAPRLGVAVLFGWVVAGQILTSLLVDRFGWLGLPQHPLTPSRLAGAALLLAGVCLLGRK